MNVNSKIKDKYILIWILENIDDDEKDIDLLRYVTDNGAMFIVDNYAPIKLLCDRCGRIGNIVEKLLIRLFESQLD